MTAPTQSPGTIDVARVQEANIDEANCTRKRVVMTTRIPKFTSIDPTKPWVLLEAEDGCGLVIAAMGPDSLASQADGARLMRLWNAEIDAAQGEMTRNSS